MGHATKRGLKDHAPRLKQFGLWRYGLVVNDPCDGIDFFMDESAREEELEQLGPARFGEEPEWKEAEAAGLVTQLGRVRYRGDRRIGRDTLADALGIEDALEALGSKVRALGQQLQDAIEQNVKAEELFDGPPWDWMRKDAFCESLLCSQSDCSKVSQTIVDISLQASWLMSIFKERELAEFNSDAASADIPPF
jgi:hypothetical protein